MQRLITVFDPSAGSTNLGDKVIVNSCMRELSKLTERPFFFCPSLHQPLTKKVRRTIASSDLVVVAGSNMLNTRLGIGPHLTRWRFSLIDALAFKNVVLMGSGWNRMTDWVNPLGSFILRTGLSSDIPHAVRDDLTREKALKIGLKTVLNTSCPSLWQFEGGITPATCEGVSSAVVITLTANESDRERDEQMLKILSEKFEQVYFWPQGSKDNAYLDSLGYGGEVVRLDASLEAYDRLLEAEPVSYVGTRLHGGIRALQKGRKALIISVDHRAKGVAASSGIVVLERAEMDSLPYKLDALDYPEIILPNDAIEQWRDAVRTIL